MKSEELREEISIELEAINRVVAELLALLADVRSLATETFYADCRDALRSGGVFVVNFIADEPRFGTYLARLERVFDGRVLCLPSQDRMNMIVLGFRDRADAVPIAPLKRTARELERRLELPFDRFVRDLVAHNPGDARHLGFRHDET